MLILTDLILTDLVNIYLYYPGKRLLSQLFILLTDQYPIEL